MADVEELKKLAAAKIGAALNAESVPSWYFNSFVNSLTNTDGIILLEHNQKPIVVLNASFSTIKSLATKLTELVKQLEDITERDIMTGDFIADQMTRYNDAKK